MCAAHGLEFEVENIAIASDQKIAFMPYRT